MNRYATRYHWEGTDRDQDAKTRSFRLLTQLGDSSLDRLLALDQSQSMQEAYNRDPNDIDLILIQDQFFMSLVRDYFALDKNKDAVILKHI